MCQNNGINGIEMRETGREITRVLINRPAYNYRYLVHANGVCAAYSLLSAIVSAVPRPSTMPRAWTFFLLDQVLQLRRLSNPTESYIVLI